MSCQASPHEIVVSFASFSLDRQRKEDTASVLHRKSVYGMECRNRLPAYSITENIFLIIGNPLDF
jgi:hypothetical protein